MYCLRYAWLPALWTISQYFLVAVDLVKTWPAIATTQLVVHFFHGSYISSTRKPIPSADFRKSPVALVMCNV
ncbi:hypothetical protein B0T24DRAFT_639516 [Lasiosphaeria ovina]|uniref:Uncharacterized protein n=1 Tax=Lasiosphaeria ovina TaxID=92902 RepID=A0AAE0JVR9_9PEZI|nr:hypothetical protein B0T24DRAFT_639516 [Lasiosphaeria ovina]